MGNLCRESVVGSTKDFRRRQRRLSSRISRSTCLRLIFQAVQPPELLFDAAMAVEAVFQRDRLDLVAQVRLPPAGRADFAEAIEAGARHAAEPAQMFD